MNMTTLNFALTRTAGRELQAGDEIVTTMLDHDGGVAPWVELAEDKGLVVKIVEATDEFIVDYDSLEQQLSDRTRVVAFAIASNATGSLADAARICKLARDAGALSWIDAVHYAAHEPIDVAAIGCDVLLCSPYKFCGPHLGIAYTRARSPSPGARTRRGRRSCGSRRARCRTSCSPASAQRSRTSRRSAAWSRSARTSASSGSGSSTGLPGNVTLYGPPTMEGRVPTFLFNVDGVPADAAAHRLADEGFGVWYADNWYCVALGPRLPEQSLRAGIAHYNTADEVDRLLGALASL